MPRPRKANDKKARGANSPGLLALKKAIGLDEADWRELLPYLRDGLEDFEVENFYTSPFSLELRDVPEEWYEDPEALGYVALLLIKEGKSALASAFARYFLTICDPGPGEPHGPPGVGLAWLYLSRKGIAPPIEPARLAELALFMPEDFFRDVGLDDLLPLSRLILQERHPLEAWDLHALIAAVGMARLHARAPFTLFDQLMSADWIADDVKRELCRGLLYCADEVERLRRKAEVFHAAFRTPGEQMSFPMVYLDLMRGGVGPFHPGLGRHAVRALVESLGEPIEDVISRFFLKDYHDSQSTTAVSEGVLDLLSSRREQLGEDVVKRWLRRAIKSKLASIRRAAYRVGAELFGREFARPALRDTARSVRDWAADYLSDRKTKRRRRSQSEFRGL
jgi:hypothetical protein